MPIPAPANKVAEKICSEIQVGDRIWMNGISLRVTKVLPATGLISRFETLASLPLGTEIPVPFSALSYGTVRIDAGEEDHRTGADRRGA